jgi:hypothetical protein
MMKKIFAIIAMCWIVTALTPAHAQERVWRMTAQEGEVRVQRPGLSVRAAVLNETLAPGVSVTTGASGRAVIENGAQRITVGANSRMTIAADSSDAMTRILQQVGSLMFQVDHRGAAHFRVETPFLAAVVKGTTFTVSAGTDQDTVHVAEGLLEVLSANGGASRDVASGMTVQVNHSEPDVVAPVTAFIAPGAASSVNIAPVDYASVSDGLIGGPALTTQNAGAAAGGVNAGVNAGVSVASNGVSAGAGLGGAGASASLGGGGLNANASAGGLSAGAGLGGGGLNANANAGGLGGVSAGVGAGGVNAGVSVGGVNAGVSVGGSGGGVNVNIGGIHLGL